MPDRSVPISDIPPVGAQPSRLGPEVGIVLYPAGSTLGPRVQPDYELVLMHAGSARVTVDGHVREIPAGHVGLFCPGRVEYFEFAMDQKTRHSWLALAPQRIDAATRHALDTAPPCLPLSASMQACLDLARMVAVVDDPREEPVLAAAVNTALALYVVQAAHMATARTAEHSAIGRVRQIARWRAVEGISVRELARDVGLSPEHLVRLFRRHTGVTLVALLREERLAQAINLLEHTGLSVAEVAHQAGFASQQHFARCVRATTGMTPTELRRWSWAVGPPDGPEVTIESPPVVAPERGDDYLGGARQR